MYLPSCNSSPLLQRRLSAPNAQPGLGLSGLQNILCNQASDYNSDRRSRDSGVFRTAAPQVGAFSPGAFKPGTCLPPLPFKHSPPKALCPRRGPLRAPAPTRTAPLTGLRKPEQLPASARRAGRRAWSANYLSVCHGWAEQDYEEGGPGRKVSPRPEILN